MQGLNLINWNGKRAVVIRTTDRITFKQCRRKWNWASHLKENLGPLHLPAPLWFGSAIHYALEDYHGWNVFGHPKRAFQAYCLATAKNWKRQLPHDAGEHWHLGNAMMDYYVDMWLPYKISDPTYWAPNPITGELEPQCEINFEIPLYPEECSPLIQAWCKAHGIEVILYRGTWDRVSRKEDGSLWVVEYKTAKRAEHLHYQTDPQVSTYVWAATHVYGEEIAGVIYYQFVKKEPVLPKILQSGKLSTAKNQVTSGALYKKALEQMYGEVHRAPKDNVDYLTYLYMQETENKDRYIIREQVHRNEIQSQHEAGKILLELEDMLNPDLPLYPNPTRDCSRMCSFLSACVSFDDGSDWLTELHEEFGDRDDAGERMWRMRLPKAAELALTYKKEETPDFEGIQEDARGMQLAELELGEVEYEPIEDLPGYKAGNSFDMTSV